MDKFITTELGVEKLCSICNEYYPYDTEFFYGTGTKRKSGKISLYACCKACYEIKYRTRKKQPTKQVTHDQTRN